MSSNQFLTTLAPIVNAPIADAQAALQAIIAAPTIETVTAQGGKLALDAVNPLAFSGVDIGAVAQEALNVLNAIQAHFSAASTAPTVVAPVAAS